MMESNVPTRQKVFILITKGEVGGAQSFVVQLADGLIKLGFDVSVGFGQGEFLANECKRIGATVQRFSHLRRSFNPITTIRSIIETYSTLAQGSYDVLHINSSNALFAALSAHFLKNRPKIIFTFHGLSILERDANTFFFTRWVYWITLKFLLLFVDEGVFVSNANLQEAKRLKLVSKGTVIYNGIDPNTLHFLDRATARNKLAEIVGSNLDNTFLIGSIGRLVTPKNYEFLIENAAVLCKEFPYIRFVVIGEGEERKKLEALIHKLQLENNIFLVGEVPFASQYLKGFDVFTLTSRYEGLSISIIEAMFSSISILASGVGGVIEQLEEEKEIYRFNDSKDFQQKIKRIFNNHELRKSLSQHNFDRSKKIFQKSSMVNMYLKLYIK